MNSAAKKEERVGEHDTPLTTAPAMIEFLTGVQRALLRVSHERLLAFMGRKEHRK